mmetsp:Transcript_26364/g.61645  ORF Transcript_26364/g.61645 Transcript_26364/m.61645 type:complete len:360 (+) Transcript_26364:986-2065(+)
MPFGIRGSIPAFPICRPPTAGMRSENPLAHARSTTPTPTSIAATIANIGHGSALRPRAGQRAQHRRPERQSRRRRREANGIQRRRAARTLLLLQPVRRPLDGLKLAVLLRDLDQRFEVGAAAAPAGGRSQSRQGGDVRTAAATSTATANAARSEGRYLGHPPSPCLDLQSGHLPEILDVVLLGLAKLPDEAELRAGHLLQLGVLLRTSILRRLGRRWWRCTVSAGFARGGQLDRRRVGPEEHGRQHLLPAVGTGGGGPARGRFGRSTAVAAAQDARHRRRRGRRPHHHVAGQAAHRAAVDAALPAGGPGRGDVVLQDPVGLPEGVGNAKGGRHRRRRAARARVVVGRGRQGTGMWGRLL